MPPQLEISTLQRQELEVKGYTSVPAGISPGLLERLQRLAQRLDERAMDVHASGGIPDRACILDYPTGPRVLRCTDILEDDPDTVLDLLASPGMMAIARELCGRGTVPLYVGIIYKYYGTNEVLLWHQDALHSRKFPYLNVGVYLDDADIGDGCLRYVPGTQHEPQPISEMAREHGWEIPGVVEQSAKAGDILVQDSMVLHGSQPKRKPGVRRTVYIELHPYEGILETGFHSPEWAELHRRWMAMVLRRAAPGDWPEGWKSDLPDDLADDTTEVDAILKCNENALIGHYAPEISPHPDYPIPADLR